MRKFRFQFSLRTVFIFSFLFAIVCSLVKCEINARSNFDSMKSSMQKTLAKVEEGVIADLYDLWLKDMKANPTFSTVSAHFPVVLGQSPPAFLSYNGSGESHSDEYFTGSKHDWNFRWFLLSPNTDFSKTPWKEGYPIDAINIKISCQRSWSMLSRKTSLSIEVHPATQNELMLKRLKTELNQAGIAYDIMEN